MEAYKDGTQPSDVMDVTSLGSLQPTIPKKLSTATPLATYNELEFVVRNNLLQIDGCKVAKIPKNAAG